jgi:phosphocarrier protein FPr/phosphocarrier protein
MSARNRRIDLVAPLSGILVPLDSVPDPVFAQRTVGDGVSIDPTSAELLAPVAGVVTLLHRAHHALAITTDEGVEILLHIGVDTVTLKGAGFTPRVRQGERLAVGQPLVSFDADAIARAARSLLTQIVITNGEKVRRMIPASGTVEAGRQIILSLELAGETEPGIAPTDEASIVAPAVLLPNPLGLHARPAAVMAAAAKKYRSDVRLLRGADEANAKSVTSILLLATRHGDPIRVSAAGPDAAAAVAALAWLLEDGCGERASDVPAVLPAASMTPPAVRTDVRLLRGVAASPGLAVGRIVQLVREAIEVEERGAGLERERERLNAALAEGRAQIGALKAAVGANSKGQILDAHLELLADPELIDAAIAGLAVGRSAAYVWRETYTRYAERLKQLDSALLRERANDVHDIGRRVLALLAGVKSAPIAVAAESILVAEELTPSETASLDCSKVMGLCTTLGGATGHAAILARALGIPAVWGMDPAVRSIENGTLVVLDGTDGTLHRDPTEREIAEARARLVRGLEQQQAERAATAAPAVTTDGKRIEVAANVRDAEEARRAVALGGEGVGLLRSEFLFLERENAPSEEEQANAYCAVAAALGRDRRLVIRTLDVGGDKPLAYLPLPAEDNPFLGLRGIRTSLARPDLFRSQLRAILKAASQSDLHVMFPMIATLDELRAARRIFEEERRASGCAARVGVMIEVPSAALLADRLAPEVDFFSIGTNDLTQYTLAMDRGHPQLAAQADGLHPAVLKLIALTVEAAHRCAKWVGVCGGLAGEPLAVPVLVGLGVDELSVVVPAIPAIKALVRKLSLAACQALARDVLQLGTAAEVRARLAAFDAQHYQ